MSVLRKKAYIEDKKVELEKEFTFLNAMNFLPSKYHEGEILEHVKAIKLMKKYNEDPCSKYILKNPDDIEIVKWKIDYLAEQINVTISTKKSNVRVRKRKTYECPYKRKAS